MSSLNNDPWSDTHILTESINGLLNQGKVLLVLGAGISIPFGLPPWAKLIRRLYEMVGQEPPDSYDLRTQADYFKSVHCGDDDTSFLDAITRALYLDFSPSIRSLGRNDLLRAIGAFIMFSHRQGTRNVISFAFDDIVETYLQQQGLKSKSITDDWDWSGNTDISVYHPYGFLPHGKTVDRSSTIVLDSNSYARQFGDPMDTKRQFLETQLRTHFCIFIGLSLNDTYLQALLASVHRSHAGHAVGLPYWGLTFTTSKKDANQAMMLKRRGVYTQLIANYSQALPEFIFSLINIKPVPETEEAIMPRSPSTDLYSVFISYGGPDEEFASRLNSTLDHEGVKTFLFSQHAKPGQKLHRLMREGVNRHDRVILVCSKNSLDRSGVVNEIEETLQREAREGGESILIPITLDKYVFDDWAPKRPDIAQAIRDRVVADFRDVDDNFEKYNSAVQRLISALNRTIAE